jgi:hypothetical protein
MLERLSVQHVIQQEDSLFLELNAVIRTAILILSMMAVIVAQILFLDVQLVKLKMEILNVEHVIRMQGSNFLEQLVVMEMPTLFLMEMVIVQDAHLVA